MFEEEKILVRRIPEHFVTALFLKRGDLSRSHLEGLDPEYFSLVVHSGKGEGESVRISAGSNQQVELLPVPRYPYALAVIGAVEIYEIYALRQFVFSVKVIIRHTGKI